MSHSRLASAPQRRYLAALARRAGIELPIVRDRQQASDAIRRLELNVRQEPLFREGAVRFAARATRPGVRR